MFFVNKTALSNEGQNYGVFIIQGVNQRVFGIQWDGGIHPLNMQ